MKKHTGKLNLSKRTIVNLDSRELTGKLGGGKTQGKGKTCSGNNTCFCTLGCPGTRACY